LYKRIGKLSCVFFVVTVLAAMFAAVNLVKAEPPTTLAIVPSSIVDTSITPGSTIVINASVANIADLFTWQIRVYFKPSVLNCTSATIPPDNVFAGQATIPGTPIINNTVGYVQIGLSLIGSETGFTGNGTLAQITFRVLIRGSSNLNFSKPYGTDTFLLNSNLDVIPAMVTDGYFDNRLAVPQPPVAVFNYSPTPVIVGQLITFNASASYDPDGTIVSYQWAFGDGATDSGQIVTHTYTLAGTYQANLTVTDNDGMTNSTTKEITVYAFRPAALYVDPPEIIDPTLMPPKIFTINVTVNYVTNMYDYEFKLSYNTEMLTCFGAIINRVQNQTDFTPLILIDDGAGLIFVNVTYHPPAVPITTINPLALVTVFFQVDTPGASALHFNETELSDPSHQPISHETTDGFVMTLIRDVAITNVVPSTSWAYRGWPVDVSVTAKNLGNMSESFDVKAFYDSNLIGVLPVVSLPSNTEITLTFPWNTSTVSEGNYTISAEATAVPFEFNTTNNFLTDGYVQIFTQIRDVAITNVVTSRSWVYLGVPFNITVTAKNIGDVTESFDVKVFYDSNLLGTQSVVDLPASTEIVEVFTWNTSGLTATNNYTITAEATVVPFEFNTTNNVLVDGVVQVRYVGDLNGDGKVDMKDIAIAAAAFGTYPGDPRWNPDADITGRVYLVPDGTVDMRDIALIAKNFGKGG
jgi:PKD repeat protein